VEVLKDEMLQRIIARLDDAQLHRVVQALADVESAAKAALADDPELGRHDHAHEHGPDQSHQPVAAAPVAAPIA
jgi:hypothetical protein